MRLILMFELLAMIILVSGCVTRHVPEEGYCVDDETGAKLGLSEAEEIAINSECGEKGILKETYMCNEYTGTWWIDLDVYDEVWNGLDVSKEMCNPACVVNVNTKEAEINWRCTGLLTE